MTTENCIHSTTREAKDRGYRFLVLEDCTGSYVPALHEAGMLMVKSQGGLLGLVSTSQAVLQALEPVLAAGYKPLTGAQKNGSHQT